MRYVINGRFFVRRVTGVERYARELLAELDRLAAPGEILLAVPPGAKDVPEYRNIRVERVGRLKGQLWEQLELPVFLRRMGAPAVNLCNTSPLIVPGVVCIHDMKIRAVPHSYSVLFRWWYRVLFANAVRRSKGLMTVSAFSRSEMRRYYGVPEEKVAVIPNGWQHYQRVPFDETALRRFGLEKQTYCFALGSMEPSKNLDWIIRAARRHPQWVFAVAGGVQPGVFAEGAGTELPGNLRLLGYVSDSEAKTLMRDCRAFLFPSLYEGFGIPPMEALCAGARRVMVADTPVMHEIYDDSVTYVDPRGECPDPASLPEKDGTAVLERFAWRTSAEKLLAYLRQIAGEGCP